MPLFLISRTKVVLVRDVIMTLRIIYVFLYVSHGRSISIVTPVHLGLASTDGVVVGSFIKNMQFFVSKGQL